ncbi:MAG: hypothetical protein ACRD3G_01700 [Vicinamibacterales bacterium]
MANTERNPARLQALAAAVLFSTGGAGVKVESFRATLLGGGVIVGATAVKVLMDSREGF